MSQHLKTTRAALLALTSLGLGPAAPAAAASSLELTLPTVEGRAGEIVKVPVRVREAGGLGALQMEVAFDSKVLEAQGAEAGPLLPNALLDSNTGPDRIQVALASSDPVVGGGELFVLTFRVRGQSGQRSRLEVRAVEAWDNATRSRMSVTSRPGQVVVAGLPSWLPWALAGGLLLLGFGVVLLGLIVFMVRRNRAGRSQVSGVAALLCGSCSAPVGPAMRHCPNCGARLR